MNENRVRSRRRASAGASPGRRAAIAVVLALLAGGSGAQAPPGDRPLLGRLRERLAQRPAPDEADASLEKLSLDIDGRPRSYFIHAPRAAPAGAVPLVLLFHGGRGSSAGLARNTGMNDVADANGFIAVYPETDGGNWADGRATTGDSSADLDLVRAIVDDLVRRRGADRKRVYATGISNGGIFTLRLACDLADTVAAFAPVAASLADSYATRCRPARPVPVMLIHGSADEWVRWQGGAVKQLGGGGAGGNVMPVPDTVELLRRLDGCTTAPAKETIDRDRSDDTSVEIERYAGCRPGSALALVRVVGGGHTWPGSAHTGGRLAERLVGRTTHDIDASALIWSFVQAYRLP